MPQTEWDLALVNCLLGRFHALRTWHQQSKTWELNRPLDSWGNIAVLSESLTKYIRGCMLKAAASLLTCVDLSFCTHRESTGIKRHINLAPPEYQFTTASPLPQGEKHTLLHLASQNAHTTSLLQ